MIRRTLLAAVLFVLAAACGPAPTETPLSRPAAAQRDGDPPPPPPDTTNRGGGGTIGSGT